MGEWIELKGNGKVIIFFSFFIFFHPSLVLVLLNALDSNFVKILIIMLIRVVSMNI